MATAKKHAQRSHKTYRNNGYAFSRFKPQMSHKKWMEANELRSGFFENFIGNLLAFGRGVRAAKKKV